MRWEHNRFKYIHIKYNFVKELCNNIQLDVVHLPTEDCKYVVFNKRTVAREKRYWWQVLSLQQKQRTVCESLIG